MAQTDWRTIRVFISSTFRDMQAEREELVKRVFPRLRRLCEQRGVTWGEVDLRWGITDEQKAEGQVLPICLAEIQRCRPYFIGLLGERYGWLPEEIAPELIEREPWLAEHRHHSVTELEILHGVLRDPAMAQHAFFYFRDPAYVETRPPAQRVDFTAESAEHAEKLRRLKDRIRASRLPVHENYPDPQALGELVFADLKAVIDRLYPEDSQPEPLDRDAAEHDAFAYSRARVYIGRQEYFDRLDAHAAGDGPPLVVLGDSGAGKSALLANWALRYREQHPDQLVLLHFIGATPYSADWAALLRRLMGELKRRFDIQGDIPDKPDELRLAFANWLHMAAARGRVVLVLDALNQLEDREGAPDLVWLPPVIPDNIRLVLSTLPGRPLEDLQKRGWPTLMVRPLDLEERKLLITKHLAQYTKALSPERVQHIATADQAANPLYLRALLEELRLFGAHERLDERISYYLAAQSVPELYERILARWEEDYERDRPGLVREAMTLIWAARRGLSEAELLEILGRDGEPLPRAWWSSFHLAAEESLVSRSGLIGFFHDYLREAVRRRYLPEAEDRATAHLRLADYFQAKEPGPRQVDELPWQLAEANAWQRLYRLLADLDFFSAAWQADEFDVKAYWARIEAGSSFTMVGAYQAALATPGEHDTTHIWQLSLLLADGGHPLEALSLRTHLVEYFREAGDSANLSACLGNQAVILLTRGDLEGAMTLLREAERLCRELGSKEGLQRSLGNQAVIMRDRGDLEGAMALLREAERLCRELGSKDGLSACLGNQALILQARGDLEGAMVLHREAERLCRELGTPEGLAISLVNQAHLLANNLGQPGGALPLAEEAYRLATEHGLAALVEQIEPILDSIRSMLSRP